MLGVWRSRPLAISPLTHKTKAAAGLTFFTLGSTVASRADARPTDGVAVGVVVALALPRAVVAPRA